MKIYFAIVAFLWCAWTALAGVSQKPVDLTATARRSGVMVAPGASNPDWSGEYGRLQGLGSWHDVYNDLFGNTISYGQPSERLSSYGPLPGYPAPKRQEFWQGRRMDHSGLYWMGARYYEPVSGRFLSPDPLGHAATWDLYAYAHGDPVNFADPDGRLSKRQFLEMFDYDSAAYANYSAQEELRRQAYRQYVENLPANERGVHGLPIPFLESGFHLYNTMQNGDQQAIEQAGSRLRDEGIMVAATGGLARWLRGNTTPASINSAPTKFPNLYPAETPLPYPRRELFFDGTKWRALSENGTTITPNGLYNFVAQDGKTFISRGNFGRGGHLDLSRGLDVDYAGQIRFGHGNNAGQLRFWDNASGHFKPPAGFSHQAPLPPGLFQPFTP